MQEDSTGYEDHPKAIIDELVKAGIIQSEQEAEVGEVLSTDKGLKVMDHAVEEIESGRDKGAYKVADKELKAIIRERKEQ